MSNPFQVHVLTLFPEFFDSPTQESILRRAQANGHLDFQATNIRDFTTDKHNSADDLPYGGGAGMVMKPEPLAAAIEFASEKGQELPRILMTPQGERLTQKLAKELSEGPGMILVCGHYEGIDERIREGWIDREISIGDFVLTGGEPAALVVMDSVVRLIPGVLGNAESIADESFSAPLLEYPHYTRPRTFKGMDVPEVLLSGHHGKIAEWRHEKALERTQKRRPDLLETSAGDDSEDS